MARETTPIKLDSSPIHLLHRAGQCAVDVFQAEIGVEELTPRQYAILIAVAQHEGLSQTSLVERTGIDRSTLADIVRRLLKKGLIQRRRTKEDARAYAVRLTDAGARMLKQLEPLARRVDERILEALPGQQRERFVQDHIAAVCGGASKRIHYQAIRCQAICYQACQNEVRPLNARNLKRRNRANVVCRYAYGGNQSQRDSRSTCRAPAVFADSAVTATSSNGESVLLGQGLTPYGLIDGRVEARFVVAVLMQ